MIFQFFTRIMSGFSVTSIYPIVKICKSSPTYMVSVCLIPHTAGAHSFFRGSSPENYCLLLALALELREALLEDEGSLVLSDGDLLHGDLDAHLVVGASGLGASVLLVGVVLAAAGIEDGDDGGLQQRDKTTTDRGQSPAVRSRGNTCRKLD
jgi:hypothetical protein